MKHLLFPLLSILAGLALQPVPAAPTFAPVLQDHMVFQRDRPVTLWGEAAAGESVTVRWKGLERSTPVRRGRWELTFPPMAADARGSTITATDSTGSATLSDVLVGDLWLASGQSNMEWTMAQSSRPPAGTQLNNDHVRLLRGFGLLHGLPGAYSEELYRRAAACGGYTWEWRVCSPAAVRDFSAIATCFALRLQESTGVPVGIICNAKGGSSMEAWIPAAIINNKRLYASLRGDKWLSSPDFDAWSRRRAGENLNRVRGLGKGRLRHPFAPAYQYEAAILPLTNLRLRGVIWYQGESNADTPDISLNVAKMNDLIFSWRRAFADASLPFLMVQLPRIHDPKRPHWPAFREAQQRVADTLAGVGLICTMDLGSTNSNVHPPIKAPVGHRLADLARRRVYGEQGLPTYPRITGATTEGGRLCLHFSEAVTTADGKPPRGFTLGNPKKPGSFAEVEAELTADGRAVLLPRPAARQAWRYLHTTAANPNLVGVRGGLPVFPARGERPSGKP